MINTQTFCNQSKPNGSREQVAGRRNIKGQQTLGAVDNSSFEAQRPAACPRDPEMLLNTQVYCTEIDRTGSRGQAAGRRDLNFQQPLAILANF